MTQKFFSGSNSFGERKFVIGTEYNNLSSVQILISNSLVNIELFENSAKKLFLSCISNKPEGTVYFTTTKRLLASFIKNKITLQTLFNESPSFFVEIVSKNKKALYSQKDAEIELRCGDKTFGQLHNNLSVMT